MCIFSQPVVSVTDTNIFARLLPDGWQHLVYQMKFETKQNNAIVLPVPVQLPSTDEESLEFVSLKGYEKFFGDLNKGFPLAEPKRAVSRGSLFAVDSAVKSNLKVHDVGDFVASFVPTISDFDRLDKQFRVPQESWDKIPVYSDYGFAVFQLKSLKGKPHPMAFKFKSRLNAGDSQSVFFPTVHIHDGEVHAHEGFDHTLFLQAPEFDKACGDYQQQSRLVKDSATGYVRSKWAAGEFCKVDKSRGIIDADGLVHRLTMKGTLKNTDVLAALKTPQIQAGIVPSSWTGATGAACMAGAVGLSWLFNRRNQIAAAKTNDK